MKKALVVANWKMYVESPQEARTFIATLKRRSNLYSGVGVVIAPPYTFLPAVGGALKNSTIGLGAQAVSAFEEGAHTGQVSALMLKNAGVKYVIVGHSERRAQESDEAVHVQMLAAAEAGLVPILCVGERERDAAGSHFSFVAEQVSSALKNFPKKSSSKLVIAYEPVWAIGKSAQEAMKPAELREMSIFIKKTLAETFERKAALSVPILYGGSVEPENARSLLTEGDVSGFLVGHASASVDSFVEILRACK